MTTTDTGHAPHPRFPHVFTPLRLRHRTLRARINVGAHTTNMAEGGLPGDRHIAYYRERALGGAGMIVVEPMPVHATAVLTRGNFRPGDDSVIPAFRRLTESCHEAASADGGVVMIHQLYHVGQHGDADNSFAPNWSPSGLPSYHDADGSHAMTEAEIEELLDGFVSAAGRAQQAGFDGVELFAAYHAVIDQFWTPWSNRRTDRWGGSFENRMRFSTELLERIRRACGDDFIVGLAVNVDPESAPSLGLEEVQEVVAWHDERGLMDYVTCGTGSYFDFYKLMPTSLYPARLGEPFAAALKAVTRHAVVQAESHIRTAPAAEEVLAAGHADMVSIVRGQIADPHLVAKARTGREDEVRPCISCNQLCWGRRSRDYWISCLVNPSTGPRARVGRGPLLAGRRRPGGCSSIGGGPAGLEAARVAAERGHHVTLREAAEELGGQWRSGRAPAHPIADARPPGLVRARARPPGRRGTRRRADGRRGDRGRRRRRDRGGHGREPGTGRLPARPAHGRPAARRRPPERRQHRRRAGRPRQPRAGGCCWSTTSATGAASAPRCSSRSPAAG